MSSPEKFLEKFSGVVGRPDFMPTICHKKKSVLIIVCDMPYYKKMTCGSTMGKCYMGQFMQHAKFIKYVTYMVHKIFVQPALNT
jgi:hypothetical protein